jgi:hypothetical protein
MTVFRMSVLLCLRSKSYCNKNTIPGVLDPSPNLFARPGLQCPRPKFCSEIPVLLCFLGSCVQDPSAVPRILFVQGSRFQSHAVQDPVRLSSGSLFHPILLSLGVLSFCIQKPSSTVSRSPVLPFSGVQSYCVQDPCSSIPGSSYTNTGGAQSYSV